MVAIAVGAFANQIVAGRRRHGIVVERPVVPADVAGEEDHAAAAVRSRISTSIMFEPSRCPASW